MNVKISEENYRQLLRIGIAANVNTVDEVLDIVSRSDK